MAHSNTHSRISISVRALGFLLLFMVLQLTWESLRDGPIEYWVIHDGTVRPAAFLINLMTPTVHARAVEFALRAPGGGLNILNGCEGLEALFLLCAAFAVAPLRWQARLYGLLIGIGMVFLINQARILLLFYAYRADPTLFDVLHSLAAPIAVVLLVATYFYAWLFVANVHAHAA